MTTLRALVGAGSALAFMGLVVFVPLGWTVVLYTAEITSAEQLKAPPSIGGAYTVKMTKSRPEQRKSELGQTEILPGVAYERSTSQHMMK